MLNKTIRVRWSIRKRNIYADVRDDHALFQIHRNIDGDEVYFVASGVPEARRFLCNFRVKAKAPELWWPDTGRTEAVVVFKQQREEGAFIARSEESTFIPLSLAPYESVFVVFRADAETPSDNVVSILRDGTEIS